MHHSKLSALAQHILFYLLSLNFITGQYTNKKRMQLHQKLRSIKNKHTALAIMIGFIIREVFSFWTGHPFDFELWVRLGYYTTHLQDPYGFLPSVPGLSFTNIFSSSAGATIGYLPFWPFVTAAMYLIYSLIGIQNRFIYYFLLKQPIIICDLLVAYYLYIYVKRRNSSISLWVLRFWLFSPYPLIISGIWGMFDSVAVLFLVLSLSSSNYKRSLWNGLSILAKSIPVIYSIPLSSLRLKNLSVAIAIPSLLSLAVIPAAGWPFNIVSQTLSSAITKAGESMSWFELFYLLNYLSLSSYIPPILTNVMRVIWIPLILLSTYFTYKRFGFDTDCGLVQSLIFLTLVFFIFKTQVNEQYFLYLLPLLLMDISIWHAERKRLMNAMLGTALLYLIVNNFLMLNFVAPVLPTLPSIESSLQQSFGPIRVAIKFLSGVAFTILNLLYMKKQLDASSSKR